MITLATPDRALDQSNLVKMNLKCNVILVATAVVLVVTCFLSHATKFTPSTERARCAVSSWKRHSLKRILLSFNAAIFFGQYHSSLPYR
jgi:hypothetical protein